MSRTSNLLLSTPELASGVSALGRYAPYDNACATKDVAHLYRSAANDAFHSDNIYRMIPADFCSCKICIHSIHGDNKGNWSYGYNGLGQLVRQTNASGNISCVAYDVLGRTVKRIEYYGNTNAADALNNCANPGASAKVSQWVYDTAAHGIGKLASESLTTGYAANEYSQTFVYDSLSRVQTVNKTIKGQSYSTTTSYDALSRPSVLTYPAPAGATPLAVQYNYNALGFLISINDVATPSLVYYRADTMDVRGNITHETFGNGVSTMRSYDTYNGNLTDISTTHGLSNLQGIHVTKGVRAL